MAALLAASPEFMNSKPAILPSRRETEKSRSARATFVTMLRVEARNMLVATSKAPSTTKRATME